MSSAANVVSADLAGRVVTRWDGTRLFRHGRALAPTERQQVGLLVRDLDRALAEPLTTETVKRSVKMLVAGMRQSGETFSAADLVASLVVALAGRREAAFVEAVRQILAREAEGFSDRYVPATPEIAALARRIELRWSLQRANLAEMLGLSEEPAAIGASQLTAEEMAMWREKARRLGSRTHPREAVHAGGAAARVAADLDRRRVAGSKEAVDT